MAAASARPPSRPVPRRSRLFGAAPLLSILLAALLSVVSLLPSPHASAFPHGSALVLTAHPDDEAMFFAPAITALGQDRDVWAVCVSTGQDGSITSRAR